MTYAATIFNPSLTLADRSIISKTAESKEIGTFSNSTFSYETLSKENWTSAGNILFICLIIGFMVAIIITRFCNLNFTFLLCTVIVITSVMMIIIGDRFLKNAGVFILAAILTTMLLTLFIFFVNDVIRGPTTGSNPDFV